MVLNYRGVDTFLKVLACFVAIALLGNFVLDRIPRGPQYTGKLKVCNNLVALMDRNASFCHIETTTLRDYGVPFRAIVRAEPNVSSLRTARVHSVHVFNIGRIYDIYFSLNALTVAVGVVGYAIYKRRTKKKHKN